MWPAALAAVVASVIAWIALAGGNRQGGGDSGEYDLGSGEMFDTIAPRYDLINKVISLGLDMKWRQTMIDGLQLRAGDRVMDMATGTADVAIMLSKELAKLAATTVPHTVIGIDPSAKMLDVGRQKAEKAGLSSAIQLRLGDAQDLTDIADGSVDKLTVAFGIRNVPDRLKALREFRRIMAVEESRVDGVVPAAGEAEGGAVAEGSGARVGSIVAILELQNPETGFMSYASRAFIKYAAPMLGWMMSGSGPEYGHLTDSIMAFPTVEEWKQLMGEAGLGVFSHQTMGFGTVHLYLASPIDV